MLLVIDVGNTQTVVGLYDSGDRSHQLLDHWRMATRAERTSDELALFIRHLLATRELDLATDIRGVAVSSGVPSITFELRRMCERYLELEPVILGTGVKTGMPVLYDNPARWARTGSPTRSVRSTSTADRRSWSTSAPRPPST